jgi:Dimerisation and cyclophilin-binding domain of Mon2/Guanine nucleotide exchange factor in Golgi transport N-terminal/C-terminal region of Mon2 protein
MSGAILQSELSGLIQESKRKQPEIKAAAEKSFSDLKSLHVTSEAQLAGDLLRKPSFADPFVLACKSRNAKLVTSGVICLQRLAASHALPSERLKDVLEAFREVTASGFDVQIKILQTLPSLFQTYASDIHGGLLFTSLEICGALQSSKTTVVSSTASATLQQLVSSAFEIIADEDETADSDITREVHVESDTIVLKRAANDGFEIFGDLCDIADGADAQRLKPSIMSPVFALDLILTILLSNEKVFKTHIELLVVCRRKLMPALIRRLSAKQPFAITIRSLRILYMLINHHFEYLQDESETALSLLIHFLDPEASQGWKRAACMETLRNVIANFPLLRRIFYCFDIKDGRKDIVSKMMAALAKVAAEKPVIIGLSHRSTMPARRTDDGKNGQDQTSLEAAGVEGVIGSTIFAESHTTGISAVWSLPKNPCLEQLERSDAPSVPDTYIYSLVLDSIYSLSEGLAKFVTPTSIARNERKKSQVQADEQLHESPEKYVGTDGSQIAQAVSATESQKAIRLVNPLAVTSYPQSESTKLAADLVNSCWPAFLATCATFLNAALDAEFYHNLVRAIQKLAQVACVLELSTPRDAFLTTLAKAAVPPQALTSGRTTDSRKAEISPTVQSAESVASDIASPVNKLAPGMRISSKADATVLTTRNLLCMRALLHLGIALGPTFSQEAWCILLETLQEAEHLIKMSPRSLMNQTGKPAEDVSSTEPSSSGPNLGGEIAAVQTASKKMFASTSNYDKDVFLSLLKALLSLSASTEFVHDREHVASPIDSSIFRRVGRMHQSSRSTSGSFSKLAAEDNEVLFVLSKTSEIAKSNLQRFVRQSAADSGWSLITDRLLQILKSSTATSDTRLRTASLLDAIILGTLQNLDDEDERLQREVQHRDVSVLRSQIEGLYQESTVSITGGRKTDLDIHESALETLVAIIEQQGGNLLISWQTIFKLGGTIFEEQAPPFANGAQQDLQTGDVRARSVKLIQIAFRLLQLVGSDFLNLLPLQDLLGFIELLLLFGRQHDDLNVSLTSTTFFWNLADFLHSSQNHPSLDNPIDVPTEGFLVDQINSSQDPARVIASLWFLLLLRLNILTTDSRLEVRNGAIRVTLRILDVSGPSLSPGGWHVCLSLILLRLIKSHASLLVKLQQKNSDDGPKSFDEWHASTVALLEGSINLVCHFFNEISADERFYAFWEELFEVLRSILTTPSLAVSSAVFHGVTSLFSSLQNAGYRDAHAANPALRLWSSSHPADIVTYPELGAVSAKVHDSNQEAFTAHAESVIRITEALPSVRLDQIDAAEFMQALRKTILRCVHPVYGSDVQKLAPEQERVVVILHLLSATRTSKSIEYYETLFDFILVAFKDESDLGNDSRPEIPAKQGPTSRSGQSPSFVAFASRCMDLLEKDAVAVAQHKHLADEAQTVCAALNVLSNAAKAKYSAKAHRGNPLLWRKATASALAIVEAVGSHSYSMVDQEELLALNVVYGAAIGLAVGILVSGSLEKMDRLPEEDAIAADEEHDIASFKRLSLSLIPALTKLKDPNVTAGRSFTVEIHRGFVIELFRASLITVPQYADLPSDEDLATSSISSLLQVRPGTIKKPVYHVRSRMPYLALDTLFGLAAAFDGDRTQDPDAFTDHMTLARRAAPFVLLRAAHTLKSFIADQPLRGPMPMPSKLRTEMLYILRSSLELRSEDKAFVGKEGSHAGLGRDGRRHLRVLYPLILRMWKVWRRVPRYGFSWIADEDGVEIEKCLHRWMELCGENWELADFNS